ncbi:3-isopropylmalate dehydratase large subunit, chloroplastic [Linum perenne]
MASSTFTSPSTSFISNKHKEMGRSALSSLPSAFSLPKSRKSISNKIVSVMAPQQSERSPATTGSVKTAMTMTEKILARASQKPQLSPGENVWVDVDILMTHDVCGPGSIGIFKKEFGQNAKVLLGTDSHTCTAGAFGQFATGIGNTDAGFVLGTGKLLLKVPPTLRFVMDGEMPDYILAKDLILQVSCSSA